jgi:ABC-type amino acid transport substrate-binding protein
MRKLFLCLLMGLLVYGTADAAPRVKKRTNSAKKGNVVELQEQTTPVTTLKKLSCSRMRVASMVGNAPFGWVERDAQSKQNMQSFGLGRVVFDKISKELGIPYSTTGYVTQEEAVQALARGEIDLLLGVYYRSYGAQIEIINPAYFTNVFTVYFKKGREFSVDSYNDLVGLKGVVRKEEMIYPMIKQKLPREIDLTEIVSASKAFTMLMNDEVDYILASPYGLEGELRRYKMQDDIVTTGDVLGAGTLFFAISKNSPCFSLRSEISQSIRQNAFSQQTLDADIRKLIDDWGDRFRSDEVLIKTKNNTLPQYMDDEKTEDSDKNESEQS